MPGSPKLNDVFKGCGLPNPSATDVLAWNKLSGGATKATITELKVGLFGYDITCVAEWCATSKK